ncbi:MAG: transcriptional regulator [Candidatus Lambdaproteobacteria bacterium RIFOXYD2_FULL_50_16]|uniref:Transcriptional regulator n=1 Tax=Candidatus Lambdaproteobacteria bacterium RIFOXYD2_FULL_50_16 TaxID=1817772 RepID=A0A1F6GBK7_9PROT|nr:MAG: transcriptional regulator [Candidatus Lambdaproteobacteria bacterium RIFOXYD2_FULL_50_16]
MIESHRIEYKQELTESLEKEVVAFLNAPEGGIVYLGIDKAGVVVGLEDADGVQLKVKDRLKTNILPSCMGLFDVLLEVREEKQIVKITLASGPEKPYYLKKFGLSEKGCFLRIGSASEPMTTRMIEERFAKRTRNSISRIRSPRPDLHFEQLRIYYQEKGFDLGPQFAANLELLTEEGDYNYAAYLLADQNGNSVKVAKYRATDREDLIENEEYGYCSLIKSCNQVLDRLEVENRSVTRITSKERITRRLWNAIALREAIINALIHNDYTNEAVPKIELFSDRIEITSAGSIPPGLAEEEFFSGYSSPRNKVLMRVFKDLGFVEQLGSGMPRILKSYPRESFAITPNFIRAQFPIDPLALEIEHEQRNEEKNTGKNIEQEQKDKGKSTGKNTGNRSDQIIQLITEDPSITIAAIAEAFGLGVSTVEKQIKQLKDEGRLERVGGRKEGKWILIG